MKDILTFKNVSFAYPDKPVLKNIDVSFYENDYTALIGPNGSGKSTFIKCINRILESGEGTIELFGRNLKTYSFKELGKIIGYVPQNQVQTFPYTIHEFVLMARYAYVKPFNAFSKSDETIVDNILHLTGLKELSQRYVNQLSGGERQKVYLAAALAQQPKILLLDEPTVHLDPKHHIEIQNIISQVTREQGMTVLHVTHDLTHIERWCGRVIAFKEGTIQLNGKPKDVLTQQNLKDIYATEFLFLSSEQDHNIIVPKL
jgi:iron complex transport system ATP-binding protein